LIRAGDGVLTELLGSDFGGAGQWTVWLFYDDAAVGSDREEEEFLTHSTGLNEENTFQPTGRLRNQIRFC
jgi:hypothetical protein